MNETYIYKTPQLKRILTAFLIFILMIVVTILFLHKLSLAACVGIALGGYFINTQKITLTPDRIFMKLTAVNKALVLSVAEGSISVADQKGMKAFFMTGSSATKTIVFTPKDGTKARVFYPSISHGDQIDMEKRIHEMYSN